MGRSAGNTPALHHEWGSMMHHYDSRSAGGLTSDRKRSDPRGRLAGVTPRLENVVAPHEYAKVGRSAVETVAPDDWRVSRATSVQWEPTHTAEHGGSLADGAVLRSAFPKVTVLVPSLNEARNLRHVMPRIPPWVHEIILIDGRSTDDSIAVAQAVRPDCIVLTQTQRGKGAALRAGFAAATGDIIVTLDADGSADPAEITGFVGLLMSGADYVKGSRFIQGGGTADMEWYRRAGNWVLTAVVRVLFGGRFSDLCYGYNAFWRDVLPVIAPNADGFEIETLMNLRAFRSKLRVAELPSFEALRIHGTSNLRTVADGWRVLRTIVRERLRRVLPVEIAPIALTGGSSDGFRPSQRMS